MWGWELLHHVPDVQQPCVLVLSDGGDEAFIELVRQQGVGQLTEVHLEYGGHAVDVLHDALVAVEVGDAVLVKCISVTSGNSENYTLP